MQKNNENLVKNNYNSMNNDKNIIETMGNKGR